MPNSAHGDPQEPDRLYAPIGSPYSTKMQALPRYRWIFHHVMGLMSDGQQAFLQVRIPVMPVLEYLDPLLDRGVCHSPLRAWS